MADTVSITVRIDTEHLQALDALAARQGVKRSEALRLLLRAAFAPTPPEQPPSVARSRPPRPGVPAHPAPRIPGAGRTVQTYSKSEQVTRRDR